MRARKSQKLDLNEAYPCPCRRRGRIQPIVLTEAFGCDRCQQIFVLRDDGYVIEQLSNHYPYRRAWRWTGHQWVVSRPFTPQYYILLLSMAFFAIFVFLLLWTTVQPPASASAVLRFGVMLLILVFLLVVLVMALRR
ncbi:MAG: hypothetical protein F6J97_08050 [Leptolyngbya sp. SIO4C1]|nr:hypothetical protein [Leptolyngbya sp. SIO4C1]